MLESCCLASLNLSNFRGKTIVVPHISIRMQCNDRTYLGTLCNVTFIQIHLIHNFIRIYSIRNFYSN